MNKLLIVGGDGYIGRGLQKSLSAHYDIDVTSRKNGSNLFLSLEDTDSIKEVLAKNYDEILFLASSLIGIGECDIDFTKEPFVTNINGLNNFLGILASLGSKAKFIYVSSMSVYSPHVNLPATEDSKTDPLHPYGLSKLFAEKTVAYYTQNLGIQSLILRLPGVFGGDRQSGYVANIASKLTANEQITINPKGLGFWEAIHLPDLSKIMTELLRSFKYKNPYSTINIGYGEECDFVQTAFKLRALYPSSKSDIAVLNSKYDKFFMSNKNLSEYVDMSQYSYDKALREYLGSR